MGIQWHKKLRAIEAQIRFITCFYSPQLFECLFTTNLLVPNLALEYCTFLFEFMEKDTFPQFKPPIFKALYYNKLEDENLKVYHCGVKKFPCLYFQP
jgi:hypothetical protein